MNEQRMHQLVREKKLFRYSSALERGDLDTVAAILREAEDDPELEQMLLDMSSIYSAESDEMAQTNDVALVQQMVQAHLTSGLPLDTNAEMPPLTVGDVAARIQIDATQRGQVEREIVTLASQLRQSDTPLPEDLSQRRVAQLLEQLGISVSRRFQKLFRDTAIFLSMGREQGMARLAATRRQQENQRRSRNEEQE